MKYFLYARKSTDVEDKQVLSIEAQLTELRALAKKENLEIAEEFVEKRTAKMPGRPVFNEMIKRIQKGEVQGIICWKLDRLARNPVDGGQISWMLQQGIIQHIRTHNSNYYSGDNVLMMSVEFGMANQFIRDLSSNVKRGLRAKVKRGEFPSLAPVGYLNDVRTKTIIVDKKKSKIIHEAFELYSKGNSRLEDISTFFGEKGMKSWNDNFLHKNCVKNILTNPFYYGHFKYGGEIHEGRHKPIVPKELFDKVQRVLIERGNPMKPRSEPKVFCGLLKCGTCGMMITAENKTKISKKHIHHHYTYYRCTKKSKVIKCPEIAVRQEVLDEQFSEILSNYSMPSPWAEEFNLLIKEDEKKADRESSKIIADLQNKVFNISEKIQRLLDVYLAQDIDRETYLKERNKFVSEKKSFEEKIEKLEIDATSWLAPMREWVETASGIGKIAERNDLPSKKSSLQKIFGSNLFLHDKKVQEKASAPYAALRAARQNFASSDTSFIAVAGFRFALKFQGYEPRELLLLYPAMLVYYFIVCVFAS
ncbi:MAG: recombinase family protein [Candidatus Paceibacterota bacterium]|jgi:DNA invertase Pin-like site-specific DNA recombinase/predicted transcriptional regulator